MPFSLPPINHGDATTLLHQGAKTEDLVILSYETEADLVDGYVIYRGGVKATYGPTTLTTDTLIVRNGSSSDPAVQVDVDGKKMSLKPMEAYALGTVSVVDPDGTIKASNLWFTWDAVRRSNPEEVVGRAEGVDVHISTVWIKADKMTSAAKGLEFFNVAVSTSNWKTPLYSAKAKSVFVIPGKQALAKDVRFSILGVQSPPIPQFTFLLDPRANGVQIPRIGFRQGAGIGVSWGGDLLVGESSVASMAINSYPRVQPTYAFSYVKSRVPVEQAGLNQFLISDQFGERSLFSFFGNVYTQSLDQAYERIRIPKDMFSVGTSFNFETLGRVTDRKTNYSRQLELGYERGGPVGDWGYLLQAKASRIAEGGGPGQNRLMFQANAFTPLAKSGNFTAGARLDGVYRFDASPSGYLGAEGGLSYQANEFLKFSTGLYGYHNFGTPLFAGDNFSTNQGYVVRGDWFGPANNFSLMFRYDPTLGWFDKEYRISQVMGPLEPVLAYRESPRQYSIGFKFRTGDITRLLQRRKIQRNSQVIDKRKADKK